MDFTTIFTENFVLVVMVACLVVGYIIKHAPPIFKRISNDNIPVILAVLGAVLNPIVSGLSVESVVYGALMGLSSTGLHQAFKQFIENNKTDNTDETTDEE